ncbi:Glycerol-3-phosphate ABC transporter, ATP-binding protein UgpC (TC 3.A.1.1.3) [hydrothermal vent metagenome]|uniref:Glycerol-3-phosphate ABC transporter, ATP-binding protein UgpC (TC 3.A.1.1.3) n=1 Tax=hydrothermal vent metagenome TaxID=652676 RepID=A0A3B0TFR3_9ZZZZ
MVADRAAKIEKSGAKRLIVRNLNKSFGAVHVVKDLDLDVEPGEFLVLLGPSGCGKTTALRMIAGLEQTDTGSIHIGDTDVTHVLPKYRDVAMVFQSYALYPHKTVAENIGFPLKVRGIGKQERAAAVRDAAAQVHMETLLERYPRQLSGGQRQRVALGRAIIRRPSVFLMDEPLSNLDAKLRGFMRAELKHMQHDLGVTTIYVTHDQIEAMTLAHRVAIINHGVLQQLGTPREIYNNPVNLFVAGFMGSPPMNFVEGRIEKARFVGDGVDLAVTGAGDVAKATLGFRAEDAEVVAPGKGLFDGRVYTAELTGEQTLITVSRGGANLAIKMPKDFEIDFDTEVGVKFSGEQGFLFDLETGARLEARIKAGR